MKVSLTDICDFQGGTQPPKDEWIDQPAQGYVRMLQIRDFTQSDKNYIEYVKDTGKLKTCIEDDILIGRYGASIGKILTGLAGAYNVAIVKTIPDEKVVSKKYLYWYLNSQYFQRFISNVGSRAAQAGFNKNDLGAAQIPLVDKERQEEICEVLEKANKLISLRKQQLAKLDELIKARFVEMFGDPANNVNNLPASPMTAICQIIDGDRGKNYPKQEEFSDSGFCLFLNAKNVTAQGFSFENCTYITEEKDALLRNGKLCRGDVVLTTRGTIGNLAFYDTSVPYENIRINSGMVILRMNNQVVSEIFFIEQFKMQLDSIKSRIASGSAQPQLPISTMNKIEMILPPIELQNQFAAFVERVDKQKQTVQQSLEKLELMKKALMQEYFG